MILTENKTHSISNKVFEAAHIKYLASVIQQEYNTAIQGKTPYTIKEQNIVLDFYVKCFESLSFKADSDEMFNDNSKIYQNPIHSVEMIFKHGTEKNIRLVIQHGEDYNEVTKKYFNNSYLEVSGKDDVWVNGKINIIKDYITNTVPNQIRGILNYDTLLFWLISILGGYLTIVAISLNQCRNDANYLIKNTYQTDGLLTLLIYFAFLSFVPGIFLASFIHNRIEKIKYNVYPSVELNIGPSFALTNQQKKKQFYFLWTMIVIPVLISIVCNIITGFIN